MTELEKKIAELEKQGYRKNDTYEVYENADGGITVQVFTSFWSFEEYNFTMDGKAIDAYEMGLYANPRKIF